MSLACIGDGIRIVVLGLTTLPYVVRQFEGESNGIFPLGEFLLRYNHGR